MSTISWKIQRNCTQNPRRVCHYGLTEVRLQVLEDTADLSKPHTYFWFVMTDCGTPVEQFL